MNDTIYRQEAIYAICEGYCGGRYGCKFYPECGNLTPIQNLPSAQRKTGTWIYCEDMCGVDGYRCNKCGFHVPWDYTHKFIDFIKDYRYCPNCGARMEEDDVRKPD